MNNDTVIYIVEAGDEMHNSTAIDEKLKLNTQDEMQKNTARYEK